MEYFSVLGVAATLVVGRGVFVATQRPAGARVAIGQPGERSASLTS